MDYHREAELCGHSALCGKHTALLLQARLIPIKVHTDFANSDILPGAGTQFRLDFSELRINQFRFGELRRVQPGGEEDIRGEEAAQLIHGRKVSRSASRQYHALHSGSDGAAHGIGRCIAVGRECRIVEMCVGVDHQLSRDESFSASVLKKCSASAGSVEGSEATASST